MIRGDVYWCDLTPVVGCEQGGIKPVVVIQNDMGNTYCPTTIVAVITSKSKKNLPTHAHYTLRDCESIILGEQIRTVDKSRLLKRIGYIAPSVWEKQILISLGYK